MRVAITQTPGKKKLTLTVEGENNYVESRTFDRDADYKAVARAIGVDKQRVYEWIKRFRECGETSFEFAKPTEDVSISVTMRGNLQPADARDVQVFTGIDPLTILDDVLAFSSFSHAEPLFTLPSCFAVCDIDVHGMPPIANATAADLIFEVEPKPVAWWQSHRGGIKAVHVANDHFTAQELAACMSADVLSKYHGVFSGVEIAQQTYHPAYERGGLSCGPVTRRSPTEPDLGAFLRRIHHASDAEVEAKLEARGLEHGRAYGHGHCLIDPEYDSHGTPVYVGDYGLFCQSCSAYGKCYKGCRRPGYVPYSWLVESEIESNDFRDGVINFVHWHHQRFIGTALWPIVPERVLRQVYRACMKFHHFQHAKTPQQRQGIETLIGSAFEPETRLCRTGNRWGYTSTGRLASIRGLDNQLQTFPFCYYVDESGEIKLDRMRLGILQGESELSAEGYGYPNVDFLRGIDGRKYIDWLNPPKMYAAMVPSTSQFRYRAQRNEADIDQMFQGYFPGIRIDVLEFLIAAIFFSQVWQAYAILIFLFGQSGGGKTATPMVAAESFGSSVGNIRYQNDAEKFSRGIADQSERHVITLIDEIGKTQSTAELPACLLNARRGGSIHRLYHGTDVIQRTNVICMADTYIPPVIANDVQLSRRIIAVNLEAGKNAATDKRDWREIVQEIEGLRVRDLVFAEYADMLVSRVIDKINANNECLTFERFAHKVYGFSTLKESNLDDLDIFAGHRRLFDEVCKAPSVDNARFRGKGWKVVDVQGSSGLAAAMRSILGDNLRDLQAVASAQWGEIIGVAGVVCDVNMHGQTVGIRFRNGPARSPSTKYNAELVEGRDSGDKPNEVGNSVVTAFCHDITLDANICKISFEGVEVGW